MHKGNISDGWVPCWWVGELGSLARTLARVNPTANRALPLQALVVLNYELIIVMKTAAAVLLGTRREALFSTTRNHSSSQLHKGANQNRAPPTLSRDEDPY